MGPEYICDDPAIMPAYYGTEFAAIILPKNTEEVQSLVKLCNKHKLMFRPICTGWSGMFPKGIVLLDLRRMNHIIEINEKEHVRRRGALRYLRRAPGRMFETRPELLHQGRRLQLLRHAARPRPHGPDHHRRRPQPPRHRMGDAGRRNRPFRRARLYRRLVLRRRPGTLNALHPYLRRASGRDPGRLHQSGHKALSLAGPGRLADGGAFTTNTSWKKSPPT